MYMEWSAICSVHAGSKLAFSKGRATGFNIAIHMKDQKKQNLWKLKRLIFFCIFTRDFLFSVCSSVHGVAIWRWQLSSNQTTLKFGWFSEPACFSIPPAVLLVSAPFMLVKIGTFWFCIETLIYQVIPYLWRNEVGMQSFFNRRGQDEGFH